VSCSNVALQDTRSVGHEVGQGMLDALKDYLLGCPHGDEAYATVNFSSKVTLGVEVGREDLCSDTSLFCLRAFFNQLRHVARPAVQGALSS
jgi:hypothetical protein